MSKQLELPGALRSIGAERQFSLDGSATGEYQNVLSANDIRCGLTRLMYSTAICFGIGKDGWSERYCYADAATAKAELVLWHQRGFGEQRPIGWIACRQVSVDAIKRSMRTYHGKLYADETLRAARAAPDCHRGGGLLEFLAVNTAIPRDRLAHEIAYLRMIGEIL